MAIGQAHPPYFVPPSVCQPRPQLIAYFLLHSRRLLHPQTSFVLPFISMQCRKCHLNFSSHAELQSHLDASGHRGVPARSRVAAAAAPKLYHCKLCSVGFPSHFEMMAHVRAEKHWASATAADPPAPAALGASILDALHSGPVKALAVRDALTQLAGIGGGTTTTVVHITRTTVQRVPGGHRATSAPRRRSQRPACVAFSFDTTGSMMPYLQEVRRRLREAVTQLFVEVPHVRVALMAHGDYCDKESSYVLKHLDFTQDADELQRFADGCGSTCGGDGDECYELVLHKATKLRWPKDAKSRALVMFGDANPHEPDYVLNHNRYDWRAEAQKLADMNVPVYAVHCGGCPSSRRFYEEVARITGGAYVPLDSFAGMPRLFVAVCLKQADKDKFAAYRERVRREEPAGSVGLRVVEHLAMTVLRGSAPAPTGARRAHHDALLGLSADSEVRGAVDLAGLGLGIELGLGSRDGHRRRPPSAGRHRSARAPADAAPAPAPALMRMPPRLGAFPRLSSTLYPRPFGGADS